MAEKPNVLMIVTHDTGRYISPYGRETVRTPNCERLAAEGVLFEQSFCTAPQCCPSRGSLVTGRYPQSNGLLCMDRDTLNPDETTIGTCFQQAGYATWLLGLQHEAPHIERDAGSRLREELGFDHADVEIDRNWLTMPEYLEPLLDQRGDRPFYAQLGCFATHRPFDFMGIAADDRLGVEIPAYLTWLGANGPASRADLAQWQGMVRHFDQGLGNVLDLLDAKGLADETIVVVTTDHGEAFPRAKGTLYEAGIGTMLMMRFPKGRWQGGRRVGELVSHVDILPTLLSACGIDVPTGVQGRSFLSLLNGENYQRRTEIFAQKTMHDNYDPMRCIRTERHKLIVYFSRQAVQPIPGDIVGSGTWRECNLNKLRRATRKIELFDVVNDPVETRNLADLPAHQGLKADLLARLLHWMREVNDPILDGPVRTPHYDNTMALLTEITGETF
jgi:arylsulfatase A-like enzyme